MPDDLEGAYSVENTNPSSHQRQQPNSFHSSNVAYQTPSFGANAGDSNLNSQPVASDATYKMYSSAILVVSHPSALTLGATPVAGSATRNACSPHRGSVHQTHLSSTSTPSSHNIHLRLPTWGRPLPCETAHPYLASNTHNPDLGPLRRQRAPTPSLQMRDGLSTHDSCAAGTGTLIHSPSIPTYRSSPPDPQRRRLTQLLLPLRHWYRRRRPGCAWPRAL